MKLLIETITRAGILRDVSYHNERCAILDTARRFKKLKQQSKFNTKEKQSMRSKSTWTIQKLNKTINVLQNQSEKVLPPKKSVNKIFDDLSQSGKNKRLQKANENVTHLLGENYKIVKQTESTNLDSIVGVTALIEDNLTYQGYNNLATKSGCNCKIKLFFFIIFSSFSTKFKLRKIEIQSIKRKASKTHNNIKWR